MERRYRPNVCAIVIDEAGKLLVCERSDVSGAWQFPQGGIEEGESPKSALLRELAEEIGTKEVNIIGKLINTLCYDWPEHLYRDGYQGQEQHFFLVRLEDKSLIQLDAHDSPEFISLRWLSREDAGKLFKSFKKDTYLRALDELEAQFPGLIAK